MKRRYITTPIYYATGDPHLGHAYTTVLTDALARYYRQTGAEVRFLTGTDEHGQKMQETAAKQGMTPIELADQMAESFNAAWKDLNISFDRFIRTTEPDHIGVVTTFLERLWAGGQIYDDVYSGWYCVQDERYWTEKEVGAERLCPDCKRPVEFVEEKNYFFRMSDYQERFTSATCGWTRSSTTSLHRVSWTLREVRTNRASRIPGIPGGP
jgi:methionyl-tRNA synthetase